MKKIAVVLMAVSLSATAVAAVKNTSGSIADSGATQYLGARLGSNNAWSTSSKDSMTNDNTDLLKGFSYSYNEVTKAMTITVNEGSFREDSTYKNGDLFLHFNLTVSVVRLGHIRNIPVFLQPLFICRPLAPKN